LKLMAETQASDIFISCGARSTSRSTGGLAALEEPMDVETVQRIAYELMSKEQAASSRASSR